MTPDRARLEAAITTWRALALLTVTVIAAVVTGALLLMWVGDRPPRWWDRAEVFASEDTDADTLSQRIEQGFAAAIHRPHAGGAPWQVELSEREAGAWLAIRLRKWAANQDLEWPDNTSPPRVSFEAGTIRLGVEHDGAVYALAFRDGPLPEVRIAGAARNRVPVSRAIVERTARASFSDELAALEGAASLRLRDGRTVTLEAIESHEDRLVLTFVTRDAGS
ncbi:MAG: hypothetical protein AAGD00_09760 [Planctomycetota bacterium]